MKTLSEFLTEYLKEHLFNGGKSLDKPETFDEQLQRVIHEGIFKYRKKLGCFKFKGFGKNVKSEIINGLITAEEPKYMSAGERFI